MINSIKSLNSVFSVFSVPSVVGSLLLIILLSSCGTDNISQGNLSGTIALENNPNASGVHIGVFELAELDPVVVDANERWPHIGVIIDQKTEFDHRLQQAISIGTTDATGNFELKDIPTGEYNIVAYKAGWGFKYIYNFEINKGDNQLENLELFAETLLQDDYSEDLIMEEAHHYIIEDDLNMVPGTKLTIMPGVVIRINPAKSLTVWGEIEAHGSDGNMFWVTSNHGYDNFGTKNEPEEIERYNQLLLQNEITIHNELIDYGRFDFGTYSLSSTGNCFTNTNCIFKYNNAGFKAVQADSCFSSNCNFSFNEGNSGALFYEFILNGKANKLISVNNYIGLRLKDRFDGFVENNYLSFNTYGFEGLHFMGIIQHNDFEWNIDSDLHLTGTYGDVDESMEIYYNNFSAPTGIMSFWGFSYGLVRIYKINYNNYLNNMWFINCSSSYEFVDATKNFFDNLHDIDKIINKISVNNPNVIGIPYIVDNFLEQWINYSGICKL